MLKRTFVLFLLAFSFSHVCYALDVSAKSAILYEPETKSVIFEKNSDVAREIASTTKIMTAVVTLENADVSDIVIVPEICVGTEGTSMYLKFGEKLSVSDLLYGLMLQSGNDAAIALAYHIGDGNVENFVNLMNSTAKRIGMNDTCFKNPNGLPADGHISTAYDMALLAAYAMEIPEFAEIVSTKSKNVAGRSLSNHNKLLRLYEGTDGIKTGFTKAAGRCLVSSSERDGMRLVVVTLSAPDDWNDHMKMFDFGFDNFSVVRTPGNDDAMAQIDVVGGRQSSVGARLREEVTFLSEKKNVDEMRREIFLPRFIYAPITRGDVIGKMCYTLNGKLVKKVDIVADTTVEYYEKATLWEKILKFFRRK